MKVRIVDLDATISDDRWRLFCIDPNIDDPHDKYLSYHLLCEHDDLMNEWIVRDSPVPIVFVTSRPEYVRGKTEAWLAAHFITYEALYMRPNDNELPSDVLKPRLLWQVCNDLCCDVETAFDDRQDVLQGYRELFSNIDTVLVSAEEQL